VVDPGRDGQARSRYLHRRKITMTTQPRDNLIAWLRDAYAMEGQAVELLERQIERLEHYPEIRTKLQEHLTETKGQRAALEQAFNLLGSDPSALKASVMKVAANVQGMMHSLSSDEVMKHALGSYAFEQFEAASYQALVTAAEQAGEREVASTCSTILREEQAMAAWLWEHLPQLTQLYLQRSASGADAKR
jgi:ferritin-like metal-binding protein YciE